MDHIDQRQAAVIEIPQADTGRAAVPYYVNSRSRRLRVFVCLDQRQTVRRKVNPAIGTLFDMSHVILECLAATEIVSVHAGGTQPETMPEYCSQQGIAAAWIGCQPNNIHDGLQLYCIDAI